MQKKMNKIKTVRALVYLVLFAFLISSNPTCLYSAEEAVLASASRAADFSSNNLASQNEKEKLKTDYSSEKKSTSGKGFLGRLFGVKTSEEKKIEEAEKRRYERLKRETEELLDKKNTSQTPAPEKTQQKQQQFKELEKEKLKKARELQKIKDKEKQAAEKKQKQEFEREMKAKKKAEKKRLKELARAKIEREKKAKEAKRAEERAQREKLKREKKLAKKREKELREARKQHEKELERARKEKEEVAEEQFKKQRADEKLKKKQVEESLSAEGEKNRQHIKQQQDEKRQREKELIRERRAKEKAEKERLKKEKKLAKQREKLLKEEKKKKEKALKEERKVKERAEKERVKKEKELTKRREKELRAAEKQREKELARERKAKEAARKEAAKLEKELLKKQAEEDKKAEKEFLKRQREVERAKERAQKESRKIQEERLRKKIDEEAAARKAEEVRLKELEVAQKKLLEAKKKEKEKRGVEPVSLTPMELDVAGLEKTVGQQGGPGLPDEQPMDRRKNELRGEVEPNLQSSAPRIDVGDKKEVNILFQPVEKFVNASVFALPLMNVNAGFDAEVAQSNQFNVTDAIDRSVAVSIPNAIANKRNDLYKWDLAQAIRDLFPEANLTVDWESGGLTLGQYKSSQYAFEMKQPLFRGFSLVNAVLEEYHNKKSAKNEIQKAINEAIYDVLIAYFELTRSSLIYRNHEKLVREAGDLVKMSEDKAKQGLVSEIERLNVQKIHAEILSRYEALLGEREVASIELKRVLRMPPQEKIDITPLYQYEDYDVQEIEGFGLKISQESQEFKMEEATTLDDCLLLAYKNRPDLKLEENKLIANRYAEKSVRGKWMPQADLELGMGETSQYMRNRPQNPGDPDPNPMKFRPDFKLFITASWNLGGNTVKYEYLHQQDSPSVTTFQGAGGSTKLNNSLTMNLLDNMQQFSDVKNAELETLEQLEAYEESERQAIQEVVEAFYDYRTVIVKLRALGKSLAYQDRSTELSRYKLGRNEIQISEYLEAVRDHVGEQDEFHNVMADYFITKAELNHAIGIQDFVPIDDVSDIKSKQGRM